MKQTIENEKTFSIMPIIDEKLSEQRKKALLELQMQMATSSINHEYARMEFDESKDLDQKEELLDYMEQCRSQYLQARENLERHDPFGLIEFEQDLIRQKNSTLNHYHA
ncbi:MAG: hypothetical protein ABH859_01860 [Pseudomonadota bacterium]